jgi:transcriptional regulator with XRE-family HTH domain
MNDRLAHVIGDRVRMYRTAARRTKTVVAGLTGITPDYLYQIERGLKVPTVAVLAQLAMVLGVSVGDLLDQQPARAVKPAKAATGEAIYHALTGPVPTIGETRPLAELHSRVRGAWETWQTSPFRYRQLSHQLPTLIIDTERAVRVGQDSHEAVQSCAADLYGLLRTVAKRIGRVDLSLLAADRAVRAAEAADDPVRLAGAHWNLAQVLLSDGEAERAEAVAMHAAERLYPLVRHGSIDATALRGSLLLVAAIAAARHGDAWTARDQLREAALLAERTGERNTCWTAFGPTNVAMYAVSVEVESGEAVEGLRLAEHVDHDQSPSIERRVAFLLDQAKGYQQRRDYAAALMLLNTAEREAPEDIQYRPAAHAILRTLVQRGRRTVAADASRMAMRAGLPV